MKEAANGAFERSTEGRSAEATPYAHITTELIHLSVKRAHAMRAQALDTMLRRVGSWLARAFRRPKGPRTEASAFAHDPYARAENALKTPLTSIRSAAEILRDNHELPIEERNRFLDVVLQDNERLEKAVDGLLHALDAPARHGGRPAIDRAWIDKPAA